jgi:hypothetical protein
MEEVTIRRSALEMLLAAGRAVFEVAQKAHIAGEECPGLEQQMALQCAIVLAKKALEPPSEPTEAGGERDT